MYTKRSPAQVPFAQIVLTPVPRLDPCTQVSANLLRPHREHRVELVPKVNIT